MEEKLIYLRDIQPGDKAYIYGDGPCSGGGEYGLFELVLKVSEDKIITSNGEYNRGTGYRIGPPTAYYLSHARRKT